MAKIEAPKGTYDILPTGNPKDPWTVSSNWRAIESIARTVADLYHFAEIRTPIFESSDLFHRGVGETSDIVSKETYTFTDRDNRSLTLRPEGTAGVVRAAIENGLLNDQGARAKVYYIGPNFRYEKPQRGRYRQHWQFGVEAFGVAEPEQDVECILLQMDFYRRCGLKDLALRINSLGDRESKTKYRDALVAFLSPKAAQLSEDSQRRLTTNPLRILDSKVEKDVEACKGAPPAVDSLSEKSKAHLERVREALGHFDVPYTLDGTLVRGFDYYTDTLWEVTAGGLGAQNAIGGGGRYDGLVETLGGRPTPGVGFGSGLERLLIALDGQQVALADTRPPLVWLMAQSDHARRPVADLAAELRGNGIACDLDLTGRSMKAQMKLADREHAAWAIIIGDNELNSQSVVLKDWKQGTQQTVQRSELIATLRSQLQP